MTNMSKSGDCVTRHQMCTVIYLARSCDVSVSSPGGKRLLIDPWIAGNPACPEPSKKIGDLDLILV